MRYVFKAKTTKIVRIEANNFREAREEFLENYVVENREKIR